MKNINKELKHQGGMFVNAVLFFGFLLAISALYRNAGETRAEMFSEAHPPAGELLIQEIPGGGNNFRWRQPSEVELHHILADTSIRTVIRLNGNGKDAGALTIEEEAAICAQYGARFYFINAHQGYQAGQGYIGSAQEVYNLLSQGNIFIHCRHGYDRVGAMVGYYLSVLGYEPHEIIEHNNWQDYLEKKGRAYHKYYETALQ